MSVYLKSQFITQRMEKKKNLSISNQKMFHFLNFREALRILRKLLKNFIMMLYKGRFRKKSGQAFPHEIVMGAYPPLISCLRPQRNRMNFMQVGS
jgi:hypothetical protein